jgi:hypothetical protein
MQQDLIFVGGRVFRGLAGGFADDEPINGLNFVAGVGDGCMRTSAKHGIASGCA